MTRTTSVGRRYAAALFHAASSTGVTESVAGDLRIVRAFLEANPQVLEAFGFPRIPQERKKAALHAMVGTQLSEDLTRRFLNLMLERGREDQIAAAAHAYDHLMDEAHNVVPAEVVSAVPLDDCDLERIQARLDEITGRRVRMTVTTDPSLLGGLVARIGDTILDGSVKGYLERFENQMRDAPLAAISLNDIPAA